jgi:hypothetical protein
MPRYYFHLAAQPGSPDEIGTELRDDQTAWNQAIQAFAEYLKDGDGSISPVKLGR